MLLMPLPLPSGACPAALQIRVLCFRPCLRPELDHHMSPAAINITWGDHDLLYAYIACIVWMLAGGDFSRTGARASQRRQCHC